MNDSADKPAPPRPAQAPPAALPDAPTGQPSARELLAAIPDRLEVPAANSAYSFELLAVAGLMVLLPILYLAIIVAVGWGVVWHFRHNFW
ncbi:MAG: hypothetical protein ACKOJF_33905, partial [Planctomycetaceae bacterium]